jgi:ectoine hydroxylase-related dioxygenase (phytanoyl-CoA dioxygenase family)
MVATAAAPAAHPNMEPSMTSTTPDSVDVESSYLLPDDASDRLDRDGFVRLQGVLSPATIAHFEPAVTKAVLDLNTNRRPLEERDTYDRAFLQVTNLWQQADAARELVGSPRVAEVAARLLGVPAVRLYHDQALYKEPGGGITPWHADQYYWPLSSDRVITVWIPLQETPLDMGALEFARGSHRVEFGRDLPISDESERLLQEELTRHAFDVDRAAYAVGDASFHLGWTFHRAGANTSAVARRAMTMIYMDADIVVAEPVNDNQRADLAAFMPDTPVGSVPATPLNPVLHPADRRS